MPTAEIKLGPELVESCMNCGAQSGQVVAVIREDGRPGWFGCKKCWAMVLARGQLHTVKQMIRALDKPLDSKTRNK